MMSQKVWMAVAVLLLVVVLALVLATRVLINNSHHLDAVGILGGGDPASASLRGDLASASPRGDLASASPRVRKAMESENVIVDTLNLTHWLLDKTDQDPAARAEVFPSLAQCAPRKRAGQKKKAKGTTARGLRPSDRPRITQCTITEAIEYSAPQLKAQFSGDVIYVIKDRDRTSHDDRTRVLYAMLARRCQVSIHLTERDARDSELRASWQASGNDARSHQTSGRDDFYIGMLAWKLRCAVLTEDRMRDFQELKTEVDPFRVFAIDHWKLREEPGVGITERLRSELVNPSALEFRQTRSPIRIGFREVMQ